MGSHYVNFVPSGEAGAVEIYGKNLERLTAIKRDRDPENLFRANISLPG